MRTLILLLISSGISAACINVTAFASDFSHEKLEAHDPWVREAPPSVKILAGYLSLHNHTDKTHTILSITSPQFSRVEIHRTEIKNGMAHMSPVSKIMLSPNGKVVFEPGGLHIMLIKPKNKIKRGDMIQLTLHLSDKSTFDFTLPVKKGQGMEDHSSHDMNHNSMDEMTNHSNSKHHHK